MLLIVLGLSALAGPNTALIGYDTAQDADLLRARVSGLGGSVRYCSQSARVCAADFAGSPPLALLEAGQGVRYALPDLEMPVTQGADYPDADGTSDCSDLWELELLEAESLWALADGSGAEPVAIQDSGFLVTHEELSGTSAFAWDYGDGNSGVEVVYGVSVPGHGTFIAGMISAIGDNEVGRAGLAPGGSIAYQKIADRDSALYYSYAIEAMGEVADGDAGGARIISYSLAGSSGYAPFEDAVLALGDAGVLLVAAAANCSSAYCWDADNDRYPQYPASYEGDFILSVAGSLEDDTLNPYSHYGEESVDLAAPGADLCSPGIDSTGDYETESGTSYATPLVAAAASLVWELHPDLAAEDVATLLKATVEPSLDLSDKVASGGRMNVLDAMQAPLPELSLLNRAIALEPTGTLTLDLETRAASAEATLLLLHDESVRVTDAEGWTITRVEAGGTVSVGGESWSGLDQTATLIVGDLSAHELGDLVVTLEASATGTTEASLRVSMEGVTGAVLGAPLDEDEDETGVSAFALSIVAASAVDTGGPAETGETGDTGETDDPEETGDPGETDVPEEETGAPDSDPAQGDSLPEEKGGCACAVGSASGGLSGALTLLPGLLALLRLRRRAPVAS